jgi:hydroxyacylglutathione hydrolase
MSQLPRNTSMIVQCQSGVRSQIAASLLLAHGFANITNLSGGMNAWHAEHLPAVEA